MKAMKTSVCIGCVHARRERAWMKGMTCCWNHDRIHDGGAFARAVTEGLRVPKAARSMVDA